MLIKLNLIFTILFSCRLIFSHELIDLNTKKCSKKTNQNLTSLYPEILDNQFDFLEKNKIYSTEWRERIIQTNDKCIFYSYKKSWDKKFHLGLTEKQFYINKERYQKLCSYPYRFSVNNDNEICVDGILFGYTYKIKGEAHEKIVLNMIKKFRIPIVFVSKAESEIYSRQKSGYEGKDFLVFIETNSTLNNDQIAPDTAVTIYSRSVLSFIESNLEHVNRNFVGM